MGLILCSLVSCLLLAAQDGAAQSPAAKGPPAETKPASGAKQEASGDDSQRIFGVIPNYKTINDPNAPQPPISSKEKFKLAVHYFDPYTYAFVGVLAGVEQLRDAKPAYGQGAKGYLKRYGADFTDGVTNEFFVVWVVPSILHEDPRYFRKGEGGFLGRTAYSLSRIVITRTDSGHQRFNFSESLGNLASGAISSAYYPKEERSFGDVLVRMGTQCGYDSMFNMLKEFYPDIRDKLRHKPRVQTQKHS